MVVLQLVSSAFVSAVAGAAFAWLFGYVNDRRHQKGVRELVKQEVKHNLALLAGFSTEIAYMQRNAGEFGTTLGLASRTPEWKRARWDMPEVGAAFSPHILQHLAIWYYNLDALSRNYEQIVSMVREYEASRGPGERAAKVVADNLEPIASAAERAYKLCPFHL